MNYYEIQQQEAYTKWEQATDNNDTKQADKHMTEYLNYSQFVDQPELQVRGR